MNIIFICCTSLVMLATLLPLWRNPHWVFRALDFPRLQIALFAAILLLAMSLLIDLNNPISTLLIGLTSLCLVWQCWWIIPYTQLWPREVNTSRNGDLQLELSLITSNVLTPNRNSEGLIRLVQKYKPDILVTLESDQWWEDQLTVFERDMPHCIKCPQDNLYGMHVFSRLPLHNGEISYLVEEDVPSIHVSVELRNGQLIRMHFVHPAPPSPTENDESAERDAELIIVAKSVAETNQPVVITGDLNDVAWSSTTRLFRKISGLLDPRVGRGMFNTFHADYPLLRWPLDHIFHSHHFTLKKLERLPSIGSDHFPLYTALTFNPVRGNGQEGLNAEKEDHSRATKIAGEMGVSKNDVPNVD